MATSSTTITNPEHGHPPVIIVTDELEEMEEEPTPHFPYDSSATSELEDETSGTRVSQNMLYLVGSYISGMGHSSRWKL